MSMNSTDNTIASQEGDDSIDVETLRGRITVLERENERLRDEYSRAKQIQYRRTALALTAIGLFALLGVPVFPAVRTVLLVLGAIGLFGGVLTYYLTPDRVLTASTADGIYQAFAANGTALVDELGLQSTRVYVPQSVAGTDTPRLFIPQHRDYRFPDTLDELFVVTDDEREQGIAVTPTGAPLISEFRKALTGEISSDPTELSSQIRDGIVEQFELAESLDIDINHDSNQFIFGITNNSIGAPGRFDNPIASFIAVSIAEGVEEPIRVNVREAESTARVDFTVNCELALESPATKGMDETASRDEPERTGT